MSGTTIDQLPSAPILSGTEMLYVLQGTSDRRTTVDDVARRATAYPLPFAEAAASLAAATDVADVFIYDTRLDSDGGLWTDQFTGTSWFQEALGTATRGTKRAFPKVAILVLRNTNSGIATTLAIHDALDLDATGVPRLWMGFQASSTRALRVTGTIGTNNALTCVCALNGRIWVGQGMTGGSGVGGLTEVNFPADTVTYLTNGGLSRFPAGIVERNSTAFGAWTNVFQAGAGLIIDRNVLAIHARALPGAPLGAVSGLPIPTVAVATASGLSVIHPTGLVASVTGQSYGAVQIMDDARLAAARSGADAVDAGALPYATVTSTAWRATLLGGGTTPGALRAATITGTPSSMLRDAVGTAGGLTLLADDPAAPGNGMVASVASDYATGWMPGDARLAVLCRGVTGAIVGPDVALDCSVRAANLNVVGTLARTAVATGADLVGWSGWSAANCLEQPFAGHMDFASGPLGLAAWFALPANAGGTLLDRWSGSGARFRLEIVAKKLRAVLTDGTATVTVTGSTDVDTGLWTQAQVVLDRATATASLWINGVREASVSAASLGSLSSAGAVLRLGVDQPGAAPFGGSLALVRVSAYAPTPAQVARMYRDELPLMRAGARAFLGGASSAVRKLSRSRHSRRLAVATGAGVALFDGLQRVDFRSTATHPAMLASNDARAVAIEGGVMAAGTAANAGFMRGAFAGLDRMDGDTPPVFATRVARATGLTTNATPTALAPRIFVAERETLTVLATFVGRTVGAADGQRIVYRRRATFFRDAGGNASVQGSVEALGTDTEVTAAADGTLAVDTASQTIMAQVTGVAATNIWWQVRFDIERQSTEVQCEEVDA